MGWRRDEIWFELDVGWLREASGDGQAGAAAHTGADPFARRLAEPPADIPNGLAESRRRRAELRRRRSARRARAAALVITPAAVLPVGAQRPGSASSAGHLPADPPSVVREVAVSGTGLVDPPLPRLEQTRERLAGPEAKAPTIRWRRASSRGLPYAGSLVSGTQLPVEGIDWVTWNPVADRVPNEPHRLYGHEETIRTVISVLGAYRAENAGAPRAVVGDISFPDGGPMEAHVSHQNGLDVDVYYPRLDRRLRAPRAGRQIDRELAQDLVDRFVAAGAQKVFVGFSTGLHGPADVVVPYPNHEDHMHVRFPPPPA